jgi:hypothetical protein
MKTYQYLIFDIGLNFASACMETNKAVIANSSRRCVNGEFQHGNFAFDCSRIGLYLFQIAGVVGRQVIV